MGKFDIKKVGSTAGKQVLPMVGGAMAAHAAIKLIPMQNEVAPAIVLAAGTVGASMISNASGKSAAMGAAVMGTLFLLDRLADRLMAPKVDETTGEETVEGLEMPEGIVKAIDFLVPSMEGVAVDGLGEAEFTNDDAAMNLAAVLSNIEDAEIIEEEEEPAFDAVVALA